jgi:hypothetical protein
MHISSRNHTQEAEIISSCGDWRQSKETVSSYLSTVRKGSLKHSDPRQVIRYSFSLHTSNITAFG